MEQQEHTDSFSLLEEKVENLIHHVTTLRNEIALFEQKIQEKERTISDLNSELVRLRDIKNRTKDRIDSILEKIGELDI